MKRNSNYDVSMKINDRTINYSDIIINTSVEEIMDCNSAIFQLVLARGDPHLRIVPKYIGAVSSIGDSIIHDKLHDCRPSRQHPVGYVLSSRAIQAGDFSSISIGPALRIDVGYQRIV